MDYFSWDSTYAGNACSLGGIVIDYSHKLTEGYDYAGAFPTTAKMYMDPSFKKDTKLVDDVMNAAHIKICSKRLVDFLRTKRLKGVDFLPVTIFDHKKKVASIEYSIVHPIGLQDAIDMKASEPTLNAFDQSVSWVKQLVFDKSRIDPKIRIFRFAGLTRPVFIEKTLAEELVAQNFVGSDFCDPSTVVK
jgi:hypothetical protein